MTLESPSSESHGKIERIIKVILVTDKLTPSQKSFVEKHE
jgi:hypothetical protein